MENVDTQVIKKYNKLCDVPKEPTDTFAARYTSESHTSSNSSSSSSSSSSKSSSKPHSSPQLVIRSPPHRRQPLYSAASKTNSPTQNDISSSSATSSSSAPTISNNNNNIPEQVGENNEDLAIFSRNRESDPTPRFSTPTKRQRINSLIAQHVRLLSVTQQSSLKILDSGAGISGVGEQWKMTDLSASSEVTIQGAFGEPMKPTVQGLLGPDKLPAVLVPGMRDDRHIFSLSTPAIRP